MNTLDPKDFIITRKRKKYKFALFANSPLCFEKDEWNLQPMDVIEIGAGTGLFGVQLAETDVARRYVCVDVKADRLQKGAHQAEALGLVNVQFVRSRADQLPELFTQHSAHEVWVTFPDPFPKDRSAKRRLMHPKFLSVYADLLIPGGSLCFKTDSHPLFDWSLEQLVSEGWAIQELSFDLHESDLAARYKLETTYEKRWRSEGLRINFVRAVPPGMLAQLSR